MIIIKTPEELKKIEKAIQIGEKILDKLCRHTRRGITTLELNNLAEKLCNQHGAKPSFKGYRDFPFSICTSINEEIVHGLPSERKLQDRDIVKIDLGIEYEGCYSDQARTVIIGKVDDRIGKLVATTEWALNNAIEQCKPGNLLMNISNTISNTAKIGNVGILRNYFGHGVGRYVHEDPAIFNGRSRDMLRLKKGMVLAIEPMFVLGEGSNKVADNKWTVIADGLGAHFEKTIIIK